MEQAIFANCVLLFGLFFLLVAKYMRIFYVSNYFIKSSKDMKKFDKKREEIKQAGIKAFATYGFHKTTLDDIAGMLGMKKNSLYYYFENKEILVREILLDEIDTNLELEKDIQKMDVPAREKLLRCTESVINFIRQRTSEYAVTVESIIELGKVMRKIVPDFHNNRALAFESILAEGIKRKEFREHNSQQLAEDITELIPAIFDHHYMVTNVKFVSEINFEKISSEIKRFINYICDGITI